MKKKIRKINYKGVEYHWRVVKTGKYSVCLRLWRDKNSSNPWCLVRFGKGVYFTSDYQTLEMPPVVYPSDVTNVIYARESFDSDWKHFEWYGLNTKRLVRARDAMKAIPKTIDCDFFELETIHTAIHHKSNHMEDRIQEGVEIKINGTSLIEQLNDTILEIKTKNNPKNLSYYEWLQPNEVYYPSPSLIGANIADAIPTTVLNFRNGSNIFPFKVRIIRNEHFIIWFDFDFPYYKDWISPMGPFRFDKHQYLQNLSQGKPYDLRQWRSKNKS